MNEKLETCYSIPGDEGSSYLCDIANDLNDGETIELWEWKATKAKLVNYKMIDGALEKMPNAEIDDDANDYTERRMNEAENHGQGD